MIEKDIETQPSIPPWDFWEFLLFVAGKDIRAQMVQSSLENICKKHLAGRYSIEVIDILQDSEKAITYDIIATPTLLRQRPEPIRKILGDLSPTTKVLEALDIRLED